MSDLQTYNVDVDIKHVDMDESFLCGYLRIEGMTTPSQIFLRCLTQASNSRSHQRSSYFDNLF